MYSYAVTRLVVLVSVFPQFFEVYVFEHSQWGLDRCLWFFWLFLVHVKFHRFGCHGNRRQWRNADVRICVALHNSILRRCAVGATKPRVVGRWR